MGEALARHKKLKPLESYLKAARRNHRPSDQSDAVVAYLERRIARQKLAEKKAARAKTKAVRAKRQKKASGSTRAGKEG